MEIRSSIIGLNQGVSKANSVLPQQPNHNHPYADAAQKSSFTRISDDFVLSAEAMEMQATNMSAPEETSAARTDRLEKIRAEIASGKYDDDLKFEAALEKMYDKILDQEV